MNLADLRSVSTLLCDADGTLFASEEPAFEASAVVTNALLAHAGVAERLTAEHLRRTTTGKNFRTTAVELLAAHGIVLSPAELATWVEREAAAVTRHLAEVLRPDPAVLAAVCRLAARFGVAAVSSSALARLDACFAATGLAATFPAGRRFSAEDSLPRPRSKPDPAVYRLACERLQVGPWETVAVEDSVPGVSSAVGAGIPTVGILQFVPHGERRYRARDLLLAGACTVVHSWEEIERLLPAAPRGRSEPAALA